LFSLESWLYIAQDFLKWNDSCIYLFWDMLILAVYYLNPEKITSLKRDEILVDVEYLAVFLILHIPEPSNSSWKANTVTSSFDSVWPLNDVGEVYPTSPISSPLSPVKDASARSSLFKSPLGSPISPRSPRNVSIAASAIVPGSSQQQSSSLSPKRSIGSGAKTPRGSTQHLHSVRQKIPLILSALNPNLNESHSYDMNDDDFSSSIEAYSVSRKVVDAFGMMLAGGHSREQTVSSLLCPFRLVL
jgi:hypothetical protein